MLSGEAKRDVYVLPVKEYSERKHYCLLIAATYGLVNANNKRQKVSGDLFSSIGYTQLLYITQVFFIIEDGDLNSAAAIFVDDVLFTEYKHLVQSTIEKIQSKYELEAIVHSPGNFLY